MGLAFSFFGAVHSYYNGLWNDPTVSSSPFKGHLAHLVLSELFQPLSHPQWHFQVLFALSLLQNETQISQEWPADYKI